jgi:hypothetical protein
MDTKAYIPGFNAPKNHKCIKFYYILLPNIKIDSQFLANCVSLSAFDAALNWIRSGRQIEEARNTCATGWPD